MMIESISPTGFTRTPAARCAALLFALSGACSLSSGGLAGNDDAGVADVELDIDGRVDREDDGDVPIDRADEAEAGVEDAELDEAVEEVDAGPDGELGEEDGDLDVEDAVEVEEAEADVEDEESVEDVIEAETGVCDPAGTGDHCAGDVLERCRPDGSGWDISPCDFGCIGSGLGARCLELAPSNIADRGLLYAGTAAFDATGARVVVFDTDTGAIRAWDAAGVELASIREAGEGDFRGIFFAVQVQGAGAPELAVWSFRELDVPLGLDVIGVGARAMVLLCRGEVRIDGRIHVGASTAFLLGSTWVGHDLPGPGGASGGPPDARGSGVGSGQDGTSAGSPSNDDSGGGGAGFGGAGGDGGDIAGTGGGSGGGAYGGDALIPLVAGSGGGGGGDGLGGRGGHGAGALEIVSAVGIWIGGSGGIGAGGGFGGGGRADGGGGGAGGGGGSGGAVLLEAPRVDVAGGVAANGGGGGAGARDRDTWGNNGANGQLSIVAAAGGASSGNGTAGGLGSSDSVPDGGDGENSSSDDDAGGGGGGAGRIRLNGLVISIGGFVSPAEAAGPTTRGTLVLL